MAYAEKRGKFWRVRYKLPDGSVGSESGFETKKAAMEWGRAEEAKIQHPELAAQQPGGAPGVGITPPTST